MKTYTIADGRGYFMGVQITCAESDVASNTPPGCSAIEGAWDHLSHRVDLATGEVVDWQPPAPPDTDLVTHRWDASVRRWVADPTPKAERLRERQRIAARVAEREAAELRPLREVLIAVTEGKDPPPEAVAKLKALEAEASRMRAEMPPIDVSVR